MGLEQISRVIGATMHDMISNTIRSNADLQKAQRKEDKDRDKKTTRTTATGSAGVGIDAGSIGGQDLSNMGDMRGKSSDLFSSEDENPDEDSRELEKDLDYFKKGNVYKLKMGITETAPPAEEIEEDDYEEEEKDDDRDEEFRDGLEEEEKHKKAVVKDEEDDDRDEVLDKIKDKRSGEKSDLSEKERNITDGDPKHSREDKYTSSEEKTEEREEEEERDDIYIPQIKIKPTGILMEDGSESADLFEASSDEKDIIFNSPSLYEVLKDEEEDVSDEIKSSEEYKREQRNKNRVKKMMVYYPDVKTAKNLVQEMYVLGEKFLETCLNFGVKIVLLKKGESLSDIIPGTETTGPLRAGYYEKHKICFIGEEWVSPEYQELYRFNASVYLIALAFDHATGEDSFASLKSPFVLNNYHACRREETGHQFVDGLSANSPVEYFAQSVESYFQQDESPLSPDLTLRVFEGKICTRNELYYTDLSMYQYIDYLVNS